MLSARVCSSHFEKAEFERDLVNERLNLPVRKILKSNAVPTLNLTAESSNARKRQAAENREATASKRVRKELVAAQKDIVNSLLQEDSVKQKDAQVQVNSEGDFTASSICNTALSFY